MTLTITIHTDTDAFGEDAYDAACECESILWPICVEDLQDVIGAAPSWDDGVARMALRDRNGNECGAIVAEVR